MGSHRLPPQILGALVPSSHLTAAQTGPHHQILVIFPFPVLWDADPADVTIAVQDVLVVLTPCRQFHSVRLGVPWRFKRRRLSCYWLMRWDL
jgi:hypothetical protein